MKPYLVSITETLYRQVVVWADDESEAYERTEEYCNSSIIDLDGSDFIEREVEIEGEGITLADCLEEYGREDNARESEEVN